ncbi:hypothetical protein [Streptomyces sp. LaPpAH-108]|uniref:hypothetical protein n=1 Tax=Streptomyces sp. LaPpAH-108 TaxID=1155714 RepID=UPI00037EB3A5|nr:hypothetical protein [Streptomyces sp. LaPpAH-108]
MTEIKHLKDLTGKREFALVVRDADLVSAALRQALAEAGPEERPGLERALEIVAATGGADDDQLCARWFRDRLAAAGFTGDIGSIAALKALRQSERGLSLLTAVRLQKAAVAHPE